MKLLSIAILSNDDERLDLLEATIHSLLSTIKYPRYEIIIYKHEGTIGEGWNYLTDRVNGDYVLMCQDDWYFIGGATTDKKNEKWIYDAMEVLDNNKDIGIIRLRKSGDGQMLEPLREEHEKHFVIGIGWFSMNPFLCRREVLEKLGKATTPEFRIGIAEGEIRKRYRDMGYKTAKLKVRSEGVCIHIGKGRRFNSYKK